MLKKKVDGMLDFPGGRVNSYEADQPWTETLRRESIEELGGGFRFTIKGLAFVSRRAYDLAGQNHKVLALFYLANYLPSEIKLSDEHASFEWVPPKQLFSGNYKFISEDEAQQLQTFFS